MAYESKQWDFNKLPSSEYSNVISLLREGNLDELRRIHNNYKLSGERFCCDGYNETVRKWFAWAVNVKGIIYEEESSRTSEEGGGD